MKPVKDARTPRTLLTPVGYEDTIDLPCNYDIKAGIIWSYWETTFLERLQILFGRNIRVTIKGRVHCPIMLDTEAV